MEQNKKDKSKKKKKNNYKVGNKQGNNYGKKTNNKNKKTTVKKEVLKDTNLKSNIITSNDKYQAINKNTSDIKIKSIKAVEYQVDREHVKTITGVLLPIGNSKTEKNIRKKSYIVDSLIFTCFMLMIDVIAYFVTHDIEVINLFDSNGLNIALTLVITFAILFVVSYIIDYLYAELTVRKYNKNMKK